MIHLLNWLLLLVVLACSAFEVWSATLPHANVAFGIGCGVVVTGCAWWMGISYGKLLQVREELRHWRERD